MAVVLDEVGGETDLKHSEGRVTIYSLVLGPLEPRPPPMPPTIGLGTTRKNKTRGRICGQCEVKTTRLVWTLTPTLTHTNDTK